MEGWLILADISGYTRFLTSTELEHAAAILRELIEGLSFSMRPPYQVVEVEGDAVFAWVDTEAVPTLDEIGNRMEDCYYDFQTRLRSIADRSTCTCAACRSARQLDLKFIVHRGRFLLSEVMGRPKPLGPDVILVHRLLKNGVKAQTGWNAYLLVTEASTVSAPSTGGGWRAFQEDLEGIGPTAVWGMDLRPRFDVLREAGRYRVTPEAAAHTWRIEVDNPPASAWHAYTQVRARMRWDTIITGGHAVPNASERFAHGAEIHCAPGPVNSRLRILDWRPFDYFTYVLSTPFPLVRSLDFLITARFEPLAEGRCAVHTNVAPRAPGRLLRALTRWLVGPLYAWLQRRDQPKLARVLATSPPA